MFNPLLYLCYLLKKEITLWALCRNDCTGLSDVIWILLEIVTRSNLCVTFLWEGWWLEMGEKFVPLKLPMAACSITCCLSEYLQIFQITCTYSSGNPRETYFLSGNLRSTQTNGQERSLRKKKISKTKHKTLKGEKNRIRINSLNRNMVALTTDLSKLHLSESFNHVHMLPSIKNKEKKSS